MYYDPAATYSIAVTIFNDESKTGHPGPSLTNIENSQPGDEPWFFVYRIVDDNNPIMSINSIASPDGETWYQCNEAYWFDEIDVGLTTMDGCLIEVMLTSEMRDECQRLIKELATVAIGTQKETV